MSKQSRLGCCVIPCASVEGTAFFVIWLITIIILLYRTGSESGSVDGNEPEGSDSGTSSEKIEPKKVVKKVNVWIYVY